MQPLDVEKTQIFCTVCGVKNSPDSNFCLQCGTEIIPPHPVQMEGGEIYTLPCGRCGARLDVMEPGGDVVCDGCGLSHAIIEGKGYLTLRASM